MRSVFVVSLAACAAAAPATHTDYTTVSDGVVPILSSTHADAIPNAYIVKFKKHVTDSSASDHHVWVQKMHAGREDDRRELRKRSLLSSAEDVFAGLKHTYKVGSDFLGYAGHFDDDVIEMVRRHPDVEVVERDTIVHTMRYQEEKADNRDPALEKGAPWGLARVSHREPLAFSTYNKYLYSADGGEGVDAYVIDTGTNTEHVDFEGRAHWGKTIPANDEDVDGNGHGTHCSGTVAGKKYGVAKKANIYAVKVLKSNGSGTMSDVIAGVDFAAKRHLEQVKAAKDGKRKGFKGSVANMSLGGGKTTLLDQAVNAAVAAGIHFAVAAGNDNADACNYSPAAADKAVTVGASALDDSRAYFSNWGKCTDIFAPGLSILSTWIGSKTAVNTISGTSMASPHICGLLAYYLSLQPATDSEYSLAEITPAKLKADMLKIATVGALSDLPKDTPNLLAWNGGGCSNYSAIVSEGSHKATPKVGGKSVSSSLSDLEKAVTLDFDIISTEVVSGASSLTDKAEKFSHKLHSIVDEEIREFLADIEV